MKKLVLSLIVSAALFINTVSCVSAAADEIKEPVSGSTVKVIVTVKGDSVMASAGDYGTDFAETNEAEKVTSRLEKRQECVQNYIRSLWPEFTEEFSYSLLINGFSCSLPESLLTDVKKHHLVEKVSIVRNSMIPRMSEALSITGVSEFFSNTGCSGEGKVIAVIDSEIDVTHEMFSPADDKKVKLTRDDVSEIISTKGFNGSASADDVYINSKLPYVFDYVDGTPVDIDNYHGTGVAATAAGNRSVYDGREISGTAPDAQIVFMSAGTAAGFIDDSAVIAALEDAVMLKADAVNMSFGMQDETFDEEDPFEDAVEAAENAGIFICKSAGNYSSRMDASVSDPDISTIDNHSYLPGLCIVANASNYIDEDAYSRIDVSSSCGTVSSLEVRPDISGIGEGVITACYNNDYAMLGGTSTASPFIAGCGITALEYLEKSGYEIPEGRDKSRLIRNILMNSAVPDKSGPDIYTSPRKQGAGIVNMENLHNDRVIITGNEGEAKINLQDLLTDSFSFDAVISNISSEDVNFDKAELFLMTDSFEKLDYGGGSFRYILNGSQALRFEADVSGLKSVSAGESRKETVSVKLDGEQTSEISSIFVNGFFVEGFLLLSGADNCCDVSVPLLGYYGDYLNISDFDIKCDACSYFQTLYGMKSAYDKSGTYRPLPLKQPVYISPDKDGINDSVTFWTNFSKAFEKLYISPADNPDERQKFSYENYDSLDEKEYIITVEHFTRLKRSIENPESANIRISIDKTRPDAEFREYEKDGRKYLSVNASDKNLEGLIVTGYKPDKKDYFDAADMIISASYSSVGSYHNLHDKSGLSDIQRMIAYNDRDYNREKSYNYLDLVSADSESMTLEYDITDFQYVSAAVCDKAVNMTVYETGYSQEKYSVFYSDDNVSDIYYAFLKDRYNITDPDKTVFDSKFFTVFVYSEIEYEGRKIMLDSIIWRTTGIAEVTERIPGSKEQKLNKYCMYRYDSGLISGDADRNGTVNTLDCICLRNSLLSGTKEEELPYMDVNKDGKSDSADIVSLVTVLGKH